MNAIQQISLKLQMGIDPASEIQPETLRAMWSELSRQRFNTLQARAMGQEVFRARTTHPALRRTG